LVDKRSPTDTRETFVEIFTSDDREDMVVARQLMNDDHVQYFVRDLGDPAFPTHLGIESEQRLAVAEEQAPKAAALLKDAITDGAISPRGNLLEYR
jgi:hypothetical protein